MILKLLTVIGPDLPAIVDECHGAFASNIGESTGM